MLTLTVIMGGGDGVVVANNIEAAVDVYILDVCSCFRRRLIGKAEKVIGGCTKFHSHIYEHFKRRFFAPRFVVRVDGLF